MSTAATLPAADSPPANVELKELEYFNETLSVIIEITEWGFELSLHMPL